MSKITITIRAGGMAQVVGSLPIKHTQKKSIEFLYKKNELSDTEISKTI
jgi:hypothetical protein